ncbi:hypothetical protein OG592_40770 [Streptomyces avidinii]|uniref:hypothetical protein n=1 Tax=Streptomyces avidinii TaxID=1895 RepID=UPI00386E6136|nr:hypothetical protein OG592_00035 [Streptomyces avidinii]WST50060.1 hypothetical protein OG592_40770 [Streptomyces avidinii]
MSNHTALVLLAAAMTAMVAAATGVGAGYLARRDGATYPAAVNRAVIAFATTLTLAAVVATALEALVD